MRWLDGSEWRAAVAALVLGASLGLVACEDDEIVDVTPPAAPTGVASTTGDGQIILSWTPNREPDLAGYLVLSNDDGGVAYTIIATIDADDPDYYDPGQGPGDDFMFYVDGPLANGEAYWYAIAAFDEAGNESDLSYEYVRDVPRPEGQIVLRNRFLEPQFAGFDFSDATDEPQAWNLTSTDVYFETDGSGVPYLVVGDVDRVRVQDYGRVGFDVASYAPTDGWSRTGRVEAIRGHAYIFEIAATTASNSPVNYAKLWIYDLSATMADMDWGYQIAENERELKMPGDGSRRPAGDRKELP